MSNELRDGLIIEYINRIDQTTTLEELKLELVNFLEALRTLD